MDVTTLVVTLLIGAVSGWIAGQIKDGFGFGLLGNIVLGIVGAFVGSWLFGVVLPGVAGFGGDLFGGPRAVAEQGCDHGWRGLDE